MKKKPNLFGHRCRPDDMLLKQVVFEIIERQRKEEDEKDEEMMWTVTMTNTHTRYEGYIQDGMASA